MPAVSLGCITALQVVLHYQDHAHTHTPHTLLQVVLVQHLLSHLQHPQSPLLLRQLCHLSLSHHRPLLHHHHRRHLPAAAS